MTLKDLGYTKHEAWGGVAWQLETRRQRKTIFIPDVISRIELSCVETDEKGYFVGYKPFELSPNELQAIYELRKGLK